MQKETLKFWMVWRVGSPTTRHQHLTKGLAIKEAERLSKANPEEVFYVLKTVAAVSCQASPVKRLRLTQDDIPF